jgi:SAM-dependent methyltransferase
MDTTVRWPNVTEKMHNQIRTAHFRALLDEAPRGKLVDLGAGHGLFSIKARDLGYQVTAVDARTERLPDDMAGIEFIEVDVREFDVIGFDVVLVLGLLYHLPVGDQEALLSKCVGSWTMLETQVCIPGVVPPAAEPWGWEIVENDGYEGVVFPEEVERPTAGVGNERSFWHTEPSLLQLLSRCGFEHVEILNPPHYSKYGARKFYVLT